MWRDRTNIFISYRQSSAHLPSQRHAASSRFKGKDIDSEERGRLLPDDDDEDGELGTELGPLPPRYVDVKDEVAELISEITRKSAKLDKLHQKHVLPGFEDDDVRREEEGEIERLTQDITKNFYDCSRAIKKIETMVKSRGSGLSNAEREVAGNIQRSLAARVQEVSAVFRKKQSAYLRKLGGFGNQTAGSERSSTPTIRQTEYASNPGLLESDMDENFSQKVLSQSQQRTVTSNISAIRQREEEVIVLAKGITELSTIFRDLQAMVVDQGTIVNRIDYTVETMTEDVQNANTALNDAQGYQRRTTKRRVILLLILLIAAMIIFLIIRPKKDEVKNGAPAAPAPPVAAPPVAAPPANAAADNASPFESRGLSDPEVQQRQWRRRRRRRRIS